MGAPADVGERKSEHSLKGRGGGWRENEQTNIEMSLWGIGATRCARTSKQALKGHGGGTTRCGSCAKTSQQALKGRDGGVPAEVGEQSSKHSLTWWVRGATRCRRACKQALKGRGRGTTKCARTRKQALKSHGGGARPDVGDRANKHGHVMVGDWRHQMCANYQTILERLGWGRVPPDDEEIASRH